MVVGINFEKPIDTNQQSVITLGQIFLTEVENGEEGLNYYNNMAIGKWGLALESMTYGALEISAYDQMKLAFIDSGNFSIQMPDKVFQKLKNVL